MSSKEQQPHKSARTGTQPPTQATQQRHAAPTKPSPAAAVKAAQGGSRVLSGTRVATRGKFVLVCGRTAEREEMASAVCHLGGQSAYVHGFLMNATHVIVKDLRRTEKFLCACAAGRWILKPVYIEACKSNNQWLQEQSFEWNNARKVDKDQKDLWHGAPRRWRQYWEQNGAGPFAKYKCLLMPESHPPHDVLEKIISAGSGQVVIQEDEPTLADVQKQCRQGVTHVVVGSTCDTCISKWLNENKVPFFKGDFIMDFLAHRTAPSFNDPAYKPQLLDKGPAASKSRASKSPSGGARAKA